MNPQFSVRHIIIPSVFIFALFSINLQCDKDDWVPKTYEETVNIYPLKKSYSLNDTIWLETDLPAKRFLDRQTNQYLSIDSGSINFGGFYNSFADRYADEDYCEIFSPDVPSVNKSLAGQGVSFYVPDYGCNRTDFKLRVGFRPLVKGTFWIELTQDLELALCTGKVDPYTFLLDFRFRSVDLGLDVFEALPRGVRGHRDSVRDVEYKIAAKQMFVFKVE